MRIFRRKKLPVVYQSENAECGVACLAMIASYHGHHLDLATLRNKAEVSSRGTTLRELLRVAAGLKLRTRVVKVEPKDLHRVTLPAILHWDLTHFIVLKRVVGQTAILHDPNRGLVKIKIKDIGVHLAGIAIECSPEEGFVQRDERRPVKLKELSGEFSGVFKSVTFLGLLAVVSQSLMIAIPYYFQVVIDRVVPTRDDNFLGVVSILFVLFVALDWAIKHTRNVAALFVSMRLNIRLAVRIFEHLIRLPLSFFQSRNLTDLASKFDSLDEIRSILCEDAIRLLVDGLTLFTMIAILGAYKPPLLVCALLFMSVYVAYRIGTFQRFRLATEEQITKRVKQRSHLLESIQRIEAVKTFAAERLRLREWEGHFLSDMVGDSELKRWRGRYELSRDSLMSLEMIVSGYVAARYLIADTMTLGMLFAFFTYKRLFTTSTLSFVETIFKVRVLGLHLDRLADVIRATPEEVEFRSPQMVPITFDQALVVRDLSFSYPCEHSELLSGVSFTVNPGQRLAIVGPSGVGKSTLIKILLKLIEAQSGTITLGSMDQREVPRHHWLSGVGTVMQNDRLFGGSVRENIAFGEAEIDDAMVAKVAHLACVDEDIERFPMGYDTLVGEMGGAMSGGQIQRILIARALYKKPSLLVMDEGTANLDKHTEAAVLERVRGLGISVIHAAHRPQVIADATHVLHVGLEESFSNEQEQFHEGQSHA
uniref:ABC transporter protein n=1 Tax=Mycena chlorophos TaxID=658473 RepID=A0ABQ0L339_MYCCL|nr:ABC transporter protein [Mycena chlorophos]